MRIVTVIACHDEGDAIKVRAVRLPESGDQTISVQVGDINLYIDDPATARQLADQLQAAAQKIEEGLPCVTPSKAASSAHSATQSATESRK